MLGRDYTNQVCSISRSLEVVGERWTLLVLRDVLLDRHRFDELVESLGVTRTVLTQRLRHLVAEGVLERSAYRQRPERFEYHLTDKGRALLPMIAHLLWWGDTYYPEPAGPPRLFLHRDCGGPIRPHFTCGDCGTALNAADIATAPGPGARAGRRSAVKVRPASERKLHGRPVRDRLAGQSTRTSTGSSSRSSPPLAAPS